LARSLGAAEATSRAFPFTSASVVSNKLAIHLSSTSKDSVLGFKTEKASTHLGTVLSVALISGNTHSQATAIRGEGETLLEMENPARDCSTCYTTKKEKSKGGKTESFGRQQTALGGENRQLDRINPCSRRILVGFALSKNLVSFLANKGRDIQVIRPHLAHHRPRQIVNRALHITWLRRHVVFAETVAAAETDSRKSRWQ